MKNFHCIQVLIFFQGIFLSFFFLNAEKVNFDFNFLKNTQQWVGDFADYNVGQETFFELSWGWSNVLQQIPTVEEQKGMFLSGNNHSDALFMFIKRQIEGLKPNTCYNLTFFVTILDNIPEGQVGIGGSPGESVYFKIGASKKEPKKIAKGSIYHLNIDKGSQSEGGKNALVVGNLANPLVDPLNPQYAPINFTNSIPLTIKTDDKGRLWLFVGTNSGFEGPTFYYITHISLIAKLACER